MSFDTDFFKLAPYSGEQSAGTPATARRDEARAFLRAASDKALLASRAADDSAADDGDATDGAGEACATTSVPPVTVTLSTRASEPATHWRQAICLLQAPFAFEAGTIVRGRLRVVRDAINHREQRIRVVVSEPVAFTQDFYLSS